MACPRHVNFDSLVGGLSVSASRLDAQRIADWLRNLSVLCRQQQTVTLQVDTL